LSRHPGQFTKSPGSAFIQSA